MAPQHVINVTSTPCPLSFSGSFVWFIHPAKSRATYGFISMVSSTNGAAPYSSARVMPVVPVNWYRQRVPSSVVPPGLLPTRANPLRSASTDNVSAAWLAARESSKRASSAPAFTFTVQSLPGVKRACAVVFHERNPAAVAPANAMSYEAVGLTLDEA